MSGSSLFLAAAAGVSASCCFKGLLASFQELRSKQSSDKPRRQPPSSSGSDLDEVPPPPHTTSRRTKKREPRSYGRRQLNCDVWNEDDVSSKMSVGSEPVIMSMGFTMADARKYADADQQRAMARTPQEVLENLQKGNVRFWTGTATRPEKSAFERRALISKQFPSVAVLGCADSRVPVEIVFDQGLGDMFVVRVAGNCLDNATMASLQFAVVHLKVKVLLVMGHEACGAIKAAQMRLDDIAKEPRALAGLLSKLHEGLDGARLGKVLDPRAQDREAVVTNVKFQVAELAQNATIRSKIASKELIVLGGMYEISSGIVDFFDEVRDAVVDDAASDPRK